MYIIYKAKLQGVGFEYKMHTTFGDSFFWFNMLTGCMKSYFMTTIIKEVLSCLIPMKLKFYPGYWIRNKACNIIVNELFRL